MRRTDPDHWHRPFKDLKKRLKKAGRGSSAAHRKVEETAGTPLVNRRQPPPPETAAAASMRFRAAMADVVPLDRSQCIEPAAGGTHHHRSVSTGQADADLAALQDLLSHGHGFRVSDTPEYMAGTGWGIHPAMALRLHQGAYSVQDHIDLHGCTMAQSRMLLDRFIRNALCRGLRCVLVVHGRGLRSAHKPVLKTWFQTYLTAGPWRRWVIAFASARSCDGGAGATYLMLRQRPARKNRENRKKQLDI